MRKSLLLFSLMLGIPMIAGAQIQMYGGYAGGFELPEMNLFFRPAVIVNGWSIRYAIEPNFQKENQKHSLSFLLDPNDKNSVLEGTGTFSPAKDGSIAARWNIPANRKDAKATKLYLIASTPVAEMAGTKVEIDNGTAMLQLTEPGKEILSRDLKSFKIVRKDEKNFVRFDFQVPIHLTVRTVRDWGLVNYQFLIRAPHQIQANISSSPIVFKSIGPQRVNVSQGWTPVKVDHDIEPGSALDFSKIRGTEAPAGKYGHVVAKGDHFEFEKLPGVSQRFYGVNICGTANIPDPQSAKKLARRLRMVGYNMVRFHLHESHLVDASQPGSTHLNPKAMDHFDALVAVCIENGIYLSTDLFVSRSPISWKSIGIDKPGDIQMSQFKALVPLHEGAYSNYIAFAREFLNHKNSYTGRRLADEPALFSLSLINEGNFGGIWWIAKQLGLMEKFDAERIVEIETRFARRTTKFLHEEIKCRALITNMNNYFWDDAPREQLVRGKEFDYVDDHFYVDHPRFIAKIWRLPSSCPNTNPLKGSDQGTQRLACTRILGKPFITSEYNFSAPGRFRGVGGILAGALGAKQDWSGLFRFAWTCDLQGVKAPDLCKLSYFNMVDDPLGLAAERASICLFLRRDLPIAERSCAFLLPPSKFAGPQKFNASYAPAWAMDWAGWRVKIGSVVEEQLPKNIELLARYPEGFKKPQAELAAIVNQSPTEGIQIDSDAGSLILDTPRTMGGFAERGSIQTALFSAKIAKAPATIWASSLDGLPISDSKRILLTHLTDVQNTDIVYADKGRSILLDWGKLPHLMQNGSAEISLSLSSGNWKIWALSSGGKRRYEVPASYADGKLHFHIAVNRDPKEASYLYELTR